MAAGATIEQIYARRAAAQGAKDLLVTRAIPRPHPLRLRGPGGGAAFAALVDWVDNGVKPAGDDVLNPAAVAGPTFGCQFSVPGHAGFAPCTP